MRPDPEKVAAYARVCGFALRDHLPPTYPHVLAFPLHMAVMADGGFPFGAVGLVHVENRIVQQRRIGIGEELTIRVRPTKLEPHPKGRTFSLVTEASADGEMVWESTSTMLRRGKASADEATSNARAHHVRAEMAPNGDADGKARSDGGAEWKLGGRPGAAIRRRLRRPQPDSHALAERQGRLASPARSRTACGPRRAAWPRWRARCPTPSASTVRFRKPILLPGRVEFASAADDGEIDFAVRDAKRGTPHLDGRIEPLEDQAKDERK